MGIVIPFAEIKRAHPQQANRSAGGDEWAITDAVLAGADQAGVLAAACPLLDCCRDHYRFLVMQDGLPTDPTVLGRALIALRRGLAILDAEIASPRGYPMLSVYFGRRRLTWFEDGYSGATGLAVPNEVHAAEIAAFVRPRVTVARRQVR